MKSMNDNSNILYTFDTNDFIKHHITDIVLEIRNELMSKYKIHDGSNDNDALYIKSIDVLKSINMLKEKIQQLNDKYGTSLIVKEVYGEQKHSARIPRDSWYYQHIWALIYGLSLNDVIYVDMFSQKFQDIYDDIPDYYISTTPPPWYLDQGNDPYFNVYIKNKWIANYIVDNIDYHIWGGICNLYRKFAHL